MQYQWYWSPKTKAGTTIFLAVIIIISVLGTWGGMRYVKSTELYQGALARVHASQLIQSTLGEPISEGFFVQASFKSDGNEDRGSFNVSLNGSKSSGRLYAKATAPTGVWKYYILVVRTRDGKEIDLLKEDDNQNEKSW